MVARKVSVALLETKDEAVNFARIGKARDDIADVFEAGKAATHLEAIFLGKGINHGRGHNRGDRHLAGKVLAALETHLADVIEQQDAHLVTRNKRVVVTVSACHAHTVGIRVSCEQKVGLDLLAQFDALLHGLANLRIGIRAGGEVAIRVALLGNDGDVGHAHALENLGNRNQAGTVERRIDKFEGSLGNLLVGQIVDRLGNHGIVVRIEAGIIDPFDKTPGYRLVEIHSLDVGKGVGRLHGCRNSRCSLGGDLATIRSICLVAVIRCRVMACRHADTARTFEVARGPRKGGYGRNLRIDVGRHAVSCQNRRRRLNEKLALVAAITSNGDRRIIERLVEVIGKALRGTTDRVDIHAIGARADSSAKTSGSKLEVLEKRIRDSVCITVFF